MSEQEIQEIEVNIEQAKAWVEMVDALDRLQENPDFKLVITEGYLEKEAIRLTHLRGNPAMNTPEQQASVLKEIDGIGAFLGYLRTVYQQGDWAKSNIEYDQAMIDELRAEV